MIFLNLRIFKSYWLFKIFDSLKVKLRGATIVSPFCHSTNPVEAAASNQFLTITVQWSSAAMSTDDEPAWSWEVVIWSNYTHASRSRPWFLPLITNDGRRKWAACLWQRECGRETYWLNCLWSKWWFGSSLASAPSKVWSCQVDCPSSCCMVRSSELF